MSDIIYDLLKLVDEKYSKLLDENCFCGTKEENQFKANEYVYQALEVLGLYRIAYRIRLLNGNIPESNTDSH